MDIFSFGLDLVAYRFTETVILVMHLFFKLLFRTFYQTFSDLSDLFLWYFFFLALKYALKRLDFIFKFTFIFSERNYMTIVLFVFDHQIIEQPLFSFFRMSRIVFNKLVLWKDHNSIKLAKNFIFLLLAMLTSLGWTSLFFTERILSSSCHNYLPDSLNTSYSRFFLRIIYLIKSIVLFIF